MDVSGTVREVLRFEELKLVLPLFVSMLLIVTMFAVHYEQSHGFTEELSERLRNSYVNTTAYQYDLWVYGETARQNPRYTVDADAVTDLIADMEDNPVRYTYPMMDMIYALPIVLLPGKPDGVLLSRRDGYAPPSPMQMTYESLVLILYQGAEIANFWQARGRWVYEQNVTDPHKERELLQENTSRDEYHAFVADVREVNPALREVTQDEHTAVSNMAPFLGGPDNTVPLTRLRWYHFLPALLINAVLYYVLNGMILAGIRRVNDRVPKDKIRQDT